MPSDSVASFLTLVRANRLLEHDQYESVLEHSETPQHSIIELCDYLENRGILTPFQAERIRSGEMTSLTFAGYPILSERGPCPGGTAFSALHPSLRTPVVIRRYQPDWMKPLDTTTSFLDRTHTAAPLVHPNLATILDSGIYEDAPYVALEDFPGGDLHSLVGDMGAMPGQLAAEYARQVAAGLVAAHDKGLVHGHVRPDCIIVGPLTPMTRTRPDGNPRFRPSATATVKLFELGLIPKRPPLADWATNPLEPVNSLSYFAPERVDSSEPTPAGDVYGLGTTLYYLLTGRAPFFGMEPREILELMQNSPPTALSDLRPDVSAELAELVGRFMAKMPMARPSMAQALDELAKFGLPASTPSSSTISAAPEDATVPLATAPQSPETEPTSNGGEPIPEASVVTEEMAPLTEAIPDALPLSDTKHIPDGVPMPERGWAAPIQAEEGPTYQPPAYSVQASWENKEFNDQQWANTDYIEQTEYDPTVHVEDPHLMTHDDAPPPARPSNRGALYMWLGLGLFLQILAVLGWVYLVVQPGCPADSKPVQNRSR
jgi:eukaryotic-like serine/threonine-protein kinase